MLVNILLLVYACLHAVSFVAHAIQKATSSKLATKIATLADTAADDVDELEKAVAPSGAAAAAKAVVPMFALWLACASLLGGSIFLAAGCGATQQQTTLTTSTAVIDALRATWAAYDTQHMKDMTDQQVAMVKAGTKTRAQADADYQAAAVVWQKTQVLVNLAIDSAYRAEGIYASMKDDPTNLQNLNSAIGMLQSELLAIGAK